MCQYLQTLMYSLWSYGLNIYAQHLYSFDKHQHMLLKLNYANNKNGTNMYDLPMLIGW